MDGCVFQCRLFTSILFLRYIFFFVTIFICVHIDKHSCVYFFNYSSFLFLLFCCFFISCMRTYTQDKGNRILGRYPHALRRNCALFFFQIFSNLVNLSLEVKDWRIFHWWKWKIGRPKTQGGVLFKEYVGIGNYIGTYLTAVFF